jgi:hypothetical protein
MAKLNNDAQWIVMLGFIISIIIVFLALIVNQSMLVGKTTSESVLEFPKSDIQDMRSEIMEYYRDNEIPNENLSRDLSSLSLERKGAVIDYDLIGTTIRIHYKDGTTEYDEVVY